MPATVSQIARHSQAARVAARNSSAKPRSTYLDCIHSAFTCCSKAREAAVCGRFSAAHGLLQTALALYQRAEKETETRSLAGESHFEALSAELCYCAQTIEVKMIEHQKLTPKAGTAGDV
jgi:hypothetical protein